MTSRERVLAALSHKETDTVPFSMGFGINLPARQSLASYLNRDLTDVESRLFSLSDIRWVYPKYIGPKDRELYLPDGSHIDMWGVRRIRVDNGKDIYMEIDDYPLENIGRVEELNDYVFPDVSWFDFSNIPEDINNINHDGEYAILLGVLPIFETAWYMRGLENMLASLLIEPELAQLLLEKITCFSIEYCNRALAAAEGKIDIVFTADDIGSQTGLLLSLHLWEKMIKPCHMRLNKVIHNHGAKVMYHTDGAVMEAVNGLIDMGIDILEALQFDAKNMNPMEMKSRWGDKLCFHGGISVQSTLPFGTPEEVDAEVREHIRVLGKDGGYILAPSHAIQGGTPPENIMAFLRAAGKSVL